MWHRCDKWIEVRCGEYEDDAQRVIETALGVSVVQYDTNSGHSVPDLRIDYPDRPPGYVEVVSDNAQQAWHALDHEADGGTRTLTVPGLEYDWWVYLKGAIVNTCG
jgi:hypothetical protein